MAGFIVAKEEVNNSPFKPFSFKEKGDKLVFWLEAVDTATSATYGDFQIAKGLAVPATANTIDEAVAGAELVSFPLTTQLLNKVKNGAMPLKNLYEIEMIYKKGEKLNGRPTKSNGFSVFLLKIDENAKQALHSRYLELLGEADEVESKGFVKDKEAVDNVDTNPPREPRL